MAYTHTHTHTEEYYSAIKKGNFAIYKTWMDLERIMHSEIIQTDKDKQ